MPLYEKAATEGRVQNLKGGAPRWRRVNRSQASGPSSRAGCRARSPTRSSNRPKQSGGRSRRWSPNAVAHW